MKQLKDKKCRQCKQPFIPAASMQIVCTPQCLFAYRKAQKEKAFKAETAVMKKAIADKDRPLWIKKAQKACNEYIRERDKHLPCVSCGRHHDGQYHAGHFVPAGRGSALRFDERNIHKQCSPCNNHKSGNLVEYRKSLIVRLGAEVVEWLSSNHEISKWTIDELKKIEAEYKAKLKELKQ